MPSTAYDWQKSTPPRPDVYTTKRGNNCGYLAERYWDGKNWHSIEYSSSRGGKPFMWPKKSMTKKPNWSEIFFVRIIKDRADQIQWGLPYPVFSEKEILEYLVKKGGLRADWKNAYQIEMQRLFTEKARGRG